MSDFEAAVFLVDKPAGPTSFGMVRQVRRLLGIKKVGHAGTLDPFASGLLIICAGRPATRLISLLMEGQKEYFATIVLGIETTTQDPEGEVVAKRDVNALSEDDIAKCLQSFVGLQYQTPPQFSALKHKGKPLYFYARQGIEIQKAPRQIEITSLERVDSPVLLSGCGSELKVRVVCSKGTYIRTLAADIGTKLGCGAFLGELRRTRSGIFSVEDAITAECFKEDNAREQFLAGALSVNDVCNLLQKS
ncbi:MAG: tRNA pseudouridine(55) synthase TruB [Desulfopila sp.]|jgi:tRNA pseudouridine55 synthase|nr:tRNA pseudouridine(55) synthase TruB [Desulfopila sp.]